ncbi:MAG: DUF1353 domain-containing protein [Pseudomonadota bacterium]
MGGVTRVALVALLLASTGSPSRAEQSHFPDPLIVRALEDGRSLRLERAFRFVDSRGSIWVAPKGAIVNGASIPRVLWSVIGSPFAGKHRDASVIHDYHVEVRQRSWQRVHEVFYEGLLASGVGRTRALLMWRAVHHFGPRWSNPNCNAIERDCVLNSQTGRPILQMPPLTREALADFSRDTANFDDPLRQEIRDALKSAIE